MNDAHLHLVVNHLPIVSLLIGVLVLIFGFFLKKSEIKLTALGIFIFSGLSAILAFYTGEGAEEVVENFPNVSETLIHNHEEAAELFYVFVLILGAISIITLVLHMKKLKFASLGYIVVILLALISMFFAKNTGTTGGEIRHPEIRKTSNLQPLEIEDTNDDD
jgi:hypothetical protein